jgi:hypothetical protein
LPDEGRTLRSLAQGGAAYVQLSGRGSLFVEWKGELGAYDRKTRTLSNLRVRHPGTIAACGFFLLMRSS